MCKCFKIGKCDGWEAFCKVLEQSLGLALYIDIGGWRFWKSSSAADNAAFSLSSFPSENRCVGIKNFMNWLHYFWVLPQLGVTQFGFVFAYAKDESSFASRCWFKSTCCFGPSSNSIYWYLIQYLTSLFMNWVHFTKLKNTCVHSRRRLSSLSQRGDEIGKFQIIHNGYDATAPQLT